MPCWLISFFSVKVFCFIFLTRHWKIHGVFRFWFAVHFFLPQNRVRVSVMLALFHYSLLLFLYKTEGLILIVFVGSVKIWSAVIVFLSFVFLLIPVSVCYFYVFFSPVYMVSPPFHPCKFTPFYRQFVVWHRCPGTASCVCGGAGCRGMASGKASAGKFFFLII